MTSSTPDPSENPSYAPSQIAAALAAAHLTFGWWTLFVFLLLGLVLEALHGAKIGLYLDHSNETRRLLWTLAHAHGALLGLVHIAFASSLPRLSWARVEGLSGSMMLASRCLYGGAIALPLGFFLGGLFIYEGDPGLAVVLAPIGAGLVLLAVGLIARATRRAR